MRSDHRSALWTAHEQFINVVKTREEEEERTDNQAGGSTGGLQQSATPFDQSSPCQLARGSPPPHSTHRMEQSKSCRRGVGPPYTVGLPAPPDQ